MKLNDLASFVATRYVSDIAEFWEESIHVNEHPDILLQILAWDGVIFLGDSPVRISGWESITYGVKKKLGNVLLTTYRSIKNGKNRPNDDGSYNLISISMIRQVEHGGFIEVPDYNEMKKASKIAETVKYF